MSSRSRHLVIGLIALVGPSSVIAQESEVGLLEPLKKLGVEKCRRALGQTTRWMYEKDDFAYLNLWNESAPDDHLLSSLTSKNFSDGTMFGSIVAAPVTGGGCDVSFLQIIPLQKSCAQVRESTFKNWKYYADIGSIPTYEDPTTPNVNVALFAQQDRCLVIKNGVLFFGTESKKK